MQLKMRQKCVSKNFKSYEHLYFYFKKKFQMLKYPKNYLISGPLNYFTVIKHNNLKNKMNNLIFFF
jgi:hypothetical protein